MISSRELCVFLAILVLSIISRLLIQAKTNDYIIDKHRYTSPMPKLNLYQSQRTIMYKVNLYNLVRVRVALATSPLFKGSFSLLYIRV